MRSACQECILSQNQETKNQDSTILLDSILVFSSWCTHARDTWEHDSKTKIQFKSLVESWFLVSWFWGRECILGMQNAFFPKTKIQFKSLVESWFLASWFWGRMHSAYILPHSVRFQTNIAQVHQQQSVHCCSLKNG